MRRKKLLFFIAAAFALLFSACGSLAAQRETQKAEASVEAFFKLLAEGKYHDAPSFFQGDYFILRSMNPEIAANDYAALWKNACEINGFQCLPVRQIVNSEIVSAKEFLFTVEFENPDGSPLEESSWCGPSDDFVEHNSQFHVNVIKVNGNYKVTSLPVLKP